MTQSSLLCQLKFGRCGLAVVPIEAKRPAESLGPQKVVAMVAASFTTLWQLVCEAWQERPRGLPRVIVEERKRTRVNRWLVRGMSKSHAEEVLRPHQPN